LVAQIFPEKNFFEYGESFGVVSVKGRGNLLQKQWGDEVFN
jgi:hypothetical protein